MIDPHATSLLFVKDDPCYFQFPGLSRSPGLMHAIFTRHGGVSLPPFQSLNISYDVEDRRDAVAENIRRLNDHFRAERICYLNQRHEDDVLVLGKDNAHDLPSTPAADAVMTDLPMIALLIKQADCQGIILHDPERHVLAHVHCGWRGNVRNILGTVVMKMKTIFGCDEADLRAGIGPSLGPCCGEFVDYRHMFPPWFSRFMVRKNHFDLWAVSRRQLTDAGLKPEHIETAGICTRCGTDLFYSYRAEGKTGRFGTVAMLKDPGLRTEC